MKIFVGIDWSNEFDNVCIVNELEEIVNEFKIEISAQGFRYLVEQIFLFETNKRDVFIGIETDKNILADYLIGLGYTVYSLNPLCVNRFKDRYSACSKKDDNFDAYNISLILLKDRNRFEPVIRSSDSCETLKIHGKTLEMLIKDNTRLENRLKSELKRYFPAFTAFFKDFTSVPLNLLKIINKPGDIRNLSLEEFLNKVRFVKYMSSARKHEFYKVLSEQTIDIEPHIQKGYAMRIELLVNQILMIHDSIDKIEKEIKTLFNSNALADVFSSLPGAGPRLAPRLLMNFGDNKERFGSYQTVQCFAGTCPVTAKSGKTLLSIKVRRGCNKFFRDALYQFAFCSIQSEPWAMEYYKRQRDKGSIHSCAIRALSNKWVKIIFRMWKDGSLYNRDQFLNKRAKCAA